MAKDKVTSPRRTGEQIPLSRIRLTWTPPTIYSDDARESVTIDGARLAWVLRHDGAKPRSYWERSDELNKLELQLEGLSELLGALSDGIGEHWDTQAIFHFLHQAAAAMVRDLQHADPYVVKQMLDTATVEISDEPQAVVA